MAFLGIHISGELPVGKRDFSTLHFRQALNVLEANQDWLTATMASILENHSDYPEPKQLAICAVTRLRL